MRPQMLKPDEIRESGGFPIIYADPAWNYDQKGRGAAENHYATMSQDELCALPVHKIASKDAVLFLWATMPLVPEALEVGRAWGFEFKTCAFSWVKYHEPSGKVAMGGGQWTRANVELCLLFVRGEPPRRISAAVRQLVEEWPSSEVLRSPRGEHSAKPAEVRRRIDELMGADLPRCELFAREKAEGWFVWGNEVESDFTLDETT